MTSFSKSQFIINSHDTESEAESKPKNARGKKLLGINPQSFVYASLLNISEIFFCYEKWNYVCCNNNQDYSHIFKIFFFHIKLVAGVASNCVMQLESLTSIPKTGYVIYQHPAGNTHHIQG